MSEKKRYEVCGPSEVLGHSPGTTFEAELTPAQELLIEGGAIKPVKSAADAPLPEVKEGEEFPELEACSECGKEYPVPVGDNHTEEECLANQAEAAGSTPLDAAASTSKRGGK